ncbi:enolase-like domain-containing protein [Arthrobacter pigmenti]
MRITDIKVSEVPLDTDISNAVINFAKMTVSMVAVYTDKVVDGEPVVGYGFHSNGRYAQSGLLETRLLPRLKAASNEELLDAETGLIDPVAVRQVAMRNEKPGGHGDRAVAVGTLDMAMWDAAAKAAGQPLYRLLHDRFSPGAPIPETVSVYAAGGYYRDGGDVSALQQEIKDYLSLGYKDVKMKIGGAPLDADVERIEAVLDILPDDSRLAVDANGRFGLRTALDYAAALENYDLVWYEEPCDPLDYQTHAAIASEYSGVLATGENLFSVSEVRNMARHGGLRPGQDVLQMDPCLSYGVSEFVSMLEVLDAHGWKPDRCYPHGGHQYNLSISAAFGLGGCESYPRVFEPFGGFADETPITNGQVRLPDAPGIGIEHKSALRDLFNQQF